MLGRLSSVKCSCHVLFFLSLKKPLWCYSIIVRGKYFLTHSRSSSRPITLNDNTVCKCMLQNHQMMDLSLSTHASDKNLLIHHFLIFSQKNVSIEKCCCGTFLLLRKGKILLNIFMFFPSYVFAWQNNLQVHAPESSNDGTVLVSIKPPKRIF